ncbi:MAG: hypothetical protein M1827_001969 [Pycnora praestabilis]|nr:MAG: hypothetical protein M1827_001969 [Pycnora praestabilis]
MLTVNDLVVTEADDAQINVLAAIGNEIDVRAATPLSPTARQLSSELECQLRGMATGTNTSNDTEGHRSKRIKTETQPRKSLSRQPPDSIVTPLTNGRPIIETPPNSGMMDHTMSENTSTLDIDALAAQAADSAMAGMTGSGDVINSEPFDTMTNTHHVTNGINGTGQHDTRGQQATVPDIDLSSAPSDPTELALWVAKQINHFRDEAARDSMDSEEDEDRRRLLMHPPAMYNRQFDVDDDPVKVAERERVREENRERKKRWRQSNAERNKDNDLRCRINKRAKKLYGIHPTPFKSAWMESEFNKRRTKRETKERIRSFDGSEYFTPGFGNVLFPAPGIGPQGETNAAGLLLANALLGVGNSGAGPNADAANALKAALEGGMVDPRPFTEALRTMAMNPEIMSGINAVLGIGYPGFDEDNSGDENGEIPALSAENHANGGADERMTEDEDSSDIIKALNAATAMLNEMNESKPEGTAKESKVAPSNGFTAINGSADRKMSDVAESSSSNDNVADLGLNPSQIDALLALANGGSLDADAIDVDDSNNMVEQEQRHTPQPDSDITATLQRIVQQLMGEQNGQGTNSDSTAVNGSTGYLEGSAGQRGQSLVTSQTDPYGLASAKNPAIALSSLLRCAGVSINTVIPAAQSQATSQLYARLSSHSRASTPVGGGINPAHASSYGSTQQMNEKMLARPNAYSKPVNLPKKSVNGIAIAPPSKPKDPEILKKIKSFGYPPKPGTKLGIRKK